MTPVLGRSFLFLPGIGPVREGRLWKRGVDSWAAYRALAKVQGIRPRVKAAHDELLHLAEGAMGRDPRFFAKVLPESEHWRTFGAFGSGAAYVDIETTGDRANQVTVVGVRHAGQSHAFVAGIDYTPQAVTKALAGATCLVTFNGASFDLPVLRAEGVLTPDVPHVDLRPVLARAGYTGGLKRIEETLGFARASHVRGLSGWDAVKLWRKWVDRGDREALDTLVEYNVADFENLEPLARFACDTLQDKMLQELNAQARLPTRSPRATPAGP
jgi:uncharacterized protein YprB with RNaseH-like and TPR domain